MKDRPILRISQVFFSDIVTMFESNPSHFGQRLRWCMAMAGVKTNKDLAEKLAVTEGTIRNLLNSPKPHRNDLFLSKIARSLGVTKDFLLHGDLRPSASTSHTADNVIPYRSEAINPEILTQALALVLQELQNRKATLPPSKIAAAVVEIYELVTSQGKKEVALDNVTPFVRLLLAR